MDRYTEASFSYRGSYSVRHTKQKKTILGIINANYDKVKPNDAKSEYLKFARKTGGRLTEFECRERNGKYRCREINNHYWAIVSPNEENFTEYLDFARKTGGRLTKYDCYLNNKGELVSCRKIKAYF